MAAAYFTGGLTGLSDFGSSLGSSLFSALSGGAIDSELLTSALTDAGITSAADASAFGSALANSGWGQYLSSANAGIMGDVSTAGLFGPTAGLGDIYGTSSGLGSLIGGIGEASPTILGNTVSGLGGILGTSEGLSGVGGFTDLLNPKNLTNLGRAWKAFQTQGTNGQRSPNEVSGFMNTLQTMALMGQALQGRNGIDPNSLKTHDLVAPKGPDFAKATQNRMARKFKSGGEIQGALERVSAPVPLRGNPGGQDDVVTINAAPGEYVFDADTVAALGDGNTETGARKLDEMRYNIRKHKRSAPPDKIPPKSRPTHKYLEGKK